MRKVIFFCFLTTLSCGCFEPSGEITVMSYNVQNLFDDVRNGKEYAEFDPSYGKWTSKTFHEKLLNIAKVIKLENPDIILLTEIENQNCIDTLVKYYLPGLGYSFYKALEQSPTNCGFISRIPIEKILSHNTFSEKNDRRAILDLEVRYKAKKLYLLVNHWKSKRDGAKQSEQIRIEQATFLNSIIEEKTGHIIVAGDFNENHNEATLVNYNYQTAILNSDDIDKFKNYENSFLYTGDKSKVTDKIFYNVWDDSNEIGSYFYKEKFEKIDHFFLSKNFFTNDNPTFIKFYVLIVENLTSKNGYPLPYSKKDGIGVSDHFPILIKIKF